MPFGPSDTEPEATCLAGGLWAGLAPLQLSVPRPEAALPVAMLRAINADNADGGTGMSLGVRGGKGTGMGSKTWAPGQVC